MRIESLTIYNFRGIKGKSEYQLDGENVVFVGPNGSGKSSVLEAVDFLLTGEIQHLSGEGMQSVTTRRHGPHVDVSPDDAWVEGVFESDGEIITVKRTIADRNNPDIDTDSDKIKSEFNSVVSTAERGLHLLSRGEILEFIASTEGDRSKRIRSLLDIDDLQQKRLALSNAADELKNEASRLEREARSARETLHDTVDAGETQLTVEERVNELRQALGGDSLGSVRGGGFLDGIERPSQRVAASPLLLSDAPQRLSQVREWLSDGVDEFLEAEDEYFDTWEELDADEETKRALNRRNLIEQGKEAVDPDVKQCPLCLKPWEPENLEDHLQARLDEAADLEKKLNTLREHRNGLQQRLTDARVAIKTLTDVLRRIDRFDHEPFSDFIETLSTWEEQYNNPPSSKPPRFDLSASERKALLRPNSIIQVVDKLSSYVSEGPDLERIEEQFDTLRSANNQYKTMVKKARNAAEYRSAADDMETTHQSFLEARDEVLGEIYGEIEGQFEEYYTSLHHDESEFGVGLEPTETGLEFGVEFHGRGYYDPNALHSEGHQDSMGICLYFALCDWLSDKESLPIMMLDDVVMSIDADHRRPLANEMATQVGSDYQLFIATHDDLWHRHLRSAGVVNSDNVVQFSDWTLEDGPQLSEDPEMNWGRVERELDRGNVSIAAHQTRRMAEWFLREACHGLGGKVPFKSDGRWTLEDFKQGAISRYKDLIKSAKDAEQSHGNEIDHLSDLEDELSDIARRVNRDGKALNPNVHYNEDESEFSNCNPGELRPAVEAYRELYELFWCDSCNSCVRVTKDGQTESSVRCSCMDTLMNLEAAD